MNEQEKLSEKKDENTKKDKPAVNSDSFQYNSQDLDQEQRVDVNPVQSNTQSIHIHVNNSTIDFSGKISGTAQIAVNNRAAADACIYLFFGNDSKQPICKTKTDNNGNFLIEDLPPGYYSLYAKLGDCFEFKTNSIKVLPCQKVRVFVHLL